MDGKNPFVILDDQAIALGKPPAGATKLLGGRAFVAPTPQAMDGQPVDLADVAGRLAGLKAKVNSNYIDRAELVEALTAALAAGEHVFVLGPPGTAKSGVAQQFSDGLGGAFWRLLFNQDTPREEVFGSLDPQALKKGQWNRLWAGLATCDIAFLDEVWKASDQVSNMLLTALEERLVFDTTSHNIPLLTAIGASNEVPESREAQAAYDRWLVRLSCGYLADPDDFRAMLTARAATANITPVITPDELRLLAAGAEFMALNPTADMVDAAVELWREINQDGRVVSDRRWRKTFKLAHAYGLALGETPAPRHFGIARFTLWQDPDEEKDVRDLVMGLTDPLTGDVLDAEALLADLKNMAQGLDQLDLTGRAEIASKAQKLVGKAQALQAKDTGPYKGRLDTVAQEAQAIVTQVLEAM